MRYLQSNKHRVEGGFLFFKNNIVGFAVHYYIFIYPSIIVN